MITCTCTLQTPGGLFFLPAIQQAENGSVSKREMLAHGRKDICTRGQRYAEAQISGMEKMAGAFGYTLYVYHKNNCIGLKYDYITLAKDGF